MIIPHPIANYRILYVNKLSFVDFISLFPSSFFVVKIFCCKSNILILLAFRTKPLLKNFIQLSIVHFRNSSLLIWKLSKLFWFNSKVFHQQIWRPRIGIIKNKTITNSSQFGGELWNEAVSHRYRSRQKWYKPFSFCLTDRFNFWLCKWVKKR